MTKRRANVSQRNVTRVMLAAKAAGIAARFEIDGGKIIVEPVNGNGAAGAALAGPNPWDEVLNNDADQKRSS
jgi:hypothetical protein